MVSDSDLTDAPNTCVAHAIHVVHVSVQSHLYTFASYIWIMPIVPNDALHYMTNAHDISPDHFTCNPLLYMTCLVKLL